MLSHPLHIRPHLICLSAIYEKPQPVGVSLSLWESPAPDVCWDLVCSGVLYLGAICKNENTTFLKQTPLLKLT